MHQHTAFSLLELLIALAIMSILGCLSIESYEHYLITSRYRLASSGLADLAVRLQQYHFIHHGYEHATIEILSSALLTSPYYRFEITASDNDHFTLAATPINHQQRDTVCGQFFLNELGQHQNSLQDDNSRCWR